jgi:hypothetical protein
MRRRLEHALTVGFFVALILSPWVLGALGLRASAERENRPLLEWPELRAGDILDGGQFADIEAFATDHLPLRQESAGAINWALHAATGESPVENAFVDADGVWTLSEDYLEPCVGVFRAAELSETVDAWEAASLGRTDVVITVAPDKSSVLDDDLGLRNRLADSCQVQREQVLRDAFATSDDLLDLWSPLRARTGAGEGGLFFINDSHWTSSGAISMADELVGLFAPGLFEPGDIRPTDPATVTGDVTRRLGWERDETIDRLVYAREGVSTDLEIVPSTSGQGIRVYTSVSSQPGQLIEGTTVIVHDSMGNYAEGMLAPYFERVEFVNWNDLAAGEFLPLVPSADRIVFETVQRAMYTRTDDPLLSTDFDQAMRAALAGE